jgi:hypothetical protein
MPYMGKETATQTTQAGVAGGIAGAVLKDMFGN